MNILSKIIKFQRHIRDFWHSYGRTLLLIGVVLILLVLIVFIAKGIYTRFQIQQAMNEADMRAIGRAVCFYMVDYYPNLLTCMDAATRDKEYFRGADDKGGWGPPKHWDGLNQ